MIIHLYSKMLETRPSLWEAAQDAGFFSKIQPGRQLPFEECPLAKNDQHQGKWSAEIYLFAWM